MEPSNLTAHEEMKKLKILIQQDEAMVCCKWFFRLSAKIAEDTFFSLEIHKFCIVTSVIFGTHNST